MPSTLGSIVTNQIGASQAGISFIEHKACHASLDEMMGSIMNIVDEVGQGTPFGAVGGVTVEMVMEAISQDAQDRIRVIQQRAA